MLFTDRNGRILLVDAVYKPDWDLPGGMAGANESPVDAARREVAEELGITPVAGRLLVVDRVAPHGPWDDLLAFVLDGGVLGDEQLAAIRLQEGKLRAYAMMAQADAAGRLRDYVLLGVERAVACRGGGEVGYLHDGWAGATP